MKTATTTARPFTTKTLAYCALLAALSVVLARFLIPMPNVTTRFSIEAVPIYLAGMLFGPMAGGLVGFSADLVGCLFSGYGYNPLFCLPPILYGVFGGVFRRYLAQKFSLPRLGLSFRLPWFSAPSCGRALPCPSSTTARAASPPASFTFCPPAASNSP